MHTANVGYKYSTELWNILTSVVGIPTDSAAAKAMVKLRRFSLGVRES